MTENRSIPVKPESSSLRDRKKKQLRDRILDELIALMVEDGADLSHDTLAGRSGIGRRTVYRYFPNRESLMQAALSRVRELAGPQVAFPKSMDELVATLEANYTGFDKIAPIATVLRSTPQGRAMRLSQKKLRVKRYEAATATAVKDLPASEKKLVTAMLQVLHTTPWLEMRDTWGLDGHQIARVTGWAIRTLLADLKARRDLPLDRDLPPRIR